MPSKYPGGYQIIDLKGLDITSAGTVTLTDPELIQKVKYAFQLKKPVYIANYYSVITYPRGPVFMEYIGDSTKFSHAFIDGANIVAYIDLVAVSEDEYTISVTEI